MFLHNEPEEQLKKVVEADETYKGSKKRGKRGRGSENKTPIFGLIQRGGKLKITSVENTKRKTLEPIIHKLVKPETKMMTDEWWAYRGLNKHYTHAVVNHGRHEYVKRGRTYQYIRRNMVVT